MSTAKDALVWMLGRLGLATPSYRLDESLLSRGKQRAPDELADGLPSPALMLSDALARHDLSLQGMGTTLEFGCGCGRVVRHMGALPGQVHACDWNEKAIAWCSEQPSFARFATNTLARI